VIDLRELMDERSAEHYLPAADRLAAVQRKISIRRLRRTVSWAVGVAAVALVGYLAVPGGNPAQPSSGEGSRIASPQVAVSASATTRPTPVAGRKIGPFTEYADDYRVVAMGQAPVSSKKVQFTWTVGTADTQFWSYCPGLPNKAISLDGQYTVDGVPAGATGCVSDLHQPNLGGPGKRSTPGARVGETVTVTYTVTGAQDMANGGRKLSTIPTEGTIYFAVAEKVPFEDFPLPPRPANLQLPLPDGMASEPGTKIVFSDPDDPNKPVATTLTWHLAYDFAVIPQTPGIYTVAVNGVDVFTKEVFSYTGNAAEMGCSVKQSEKTSCIPGFTDGQIVTITITAQHATGPWLAELRSQKTSDSAHG
jgi:hypothetical protein